MKITDDTKGIKVELKTSLVSTNYELSYSELAAMIGQFMSQQDMTNERFIETFLNSNVIVNN